MQICSDLLNTLRLLFLAHTKLANSANIVSAKFDMEGHVSVYFLATGNTVTQNNLLLGGVASV